MAAQRLVDRDHVRVRRGVPGVDLGQAGFGLPEPQQHRRLEQHAQAVPAVLAAHAGVFLDGVSGPGVVHAHDRVAAPLAGTTVARHQPVEILPPGPHGGLVAADPFHRVFLGLEGDLVERSVVDRLVQRGQLGQHLVGRRTVEPDQLVVGRMLRRIGSQPGDLVRIHLVSQQAPLRRALGDREPLVGHEARLGAGLDREGEQGRAAHVPRLLQLGVEEKVLDADAASRGEHFDEHHPQLRVVPVGRLESPVPEQLALVGTHQPHPVDGLVAMTVSDHQEPTLTRHDHHLGCFDVPLGPGDGGHLLGGRQAQVAGVHALDLHGASQPADRAPLNPLSRPLASERATKWNVSGLKSAISAPDRSTLHPSDEPSGLLQGPAIPRHVARHAPAPGASEPLRRGGRSSQVHRRHPGHHDTVLLQTLLTNVVRGVVAQVAVVLAVVLAGCGRFRVEHVGVSEQLTLDGEHGLVHSWGRQFRREGPQQAETGLRWARGRRIGMTQRIPGFAHARESAAVLEVRREVVRREQTRGEHHVQEDDGLDETRCKPRAVERRSGWRCHGGTSHRDDLRLPQARP